MSWLTPVWLGLGLLAVIPVWLHLASRPPPAGHQVASVMFLQAQDLRSHHRRDLRDRLLMALRILLLVALMLVHKGSDSEYPRPLTLDPLSRRLDLHGAYEEPSLAKTIHYRAGRTLPGGLLLLGVGFMGGFFGLGGG